jgi:hypothetical protein
MVVAVFQAVQEEEVAVLVQLAGLLQEILVVMVAMD